MTNLEKYVNTIINIRNQDSTEVAVAMDIETGVLRRCSEVGCKRCKFSCRYSGNICCEVNIVRWLFSKYQEPAPKLTKAEKGFCEIIKDGYIARNEKGRLFFYSEKPVQNISGWRGLNWTELNRDYFQFITWESSKAWSIKELLELEVVDE